MQNFVWAKPSQLNFIPAGVGIQQVEMKSLYAVFCALTEMFNMCASIHPNAHTHLHFISRYYECSYVIVVREWNPNSIVNSCKYIFQKLQFSPLQKFAGMLFVAQSLYKEALVSFAVSLSIEPDYVPSIVSTAEVLMKLGSQSLPIARSFLMNALRLDPTNHEAWLNLGLLSKMEGSLQQAADYFQAAYELKLSAPVQSFW